MGGRCGKRVTDDMEAVVERGEGKKEEKLPNKGRLRELNEQ